jgi:hypothetical protein
VLALVPGEHPLLARRVNYFDSPWFLGYFDPHPNHPPPPTLCELGEMAAAPKPPSRQPRNPKLLARLVVLGGLLVGAMGPLVWSLSGGGSTGGSTERHRINFSGTWVQPPAAVIETTHVRYATVSTVNLNLRQGPAPSYDIVGVMPEGTRVKIIRDASDGWQELEVPGADGRVLRGFANSRFVTPVP